MPHFQIDVEFQFKSHPAPIRTAAHAVSQYDDLLDFKRGMEE